MAWPALSWKKRRRSNQPAAVAPLRATAATVITMFSEAEVAVVALSAGTGSSVKIAAMSSTGRSSSVVQVPLGTARETMPRSGLLGSRLRPVWVPKR